MALIYCTLFLTSPIFLYKLFEPIANYLWQNYIPLSWDSSQIFFGNASASLSPSFGQLNLCSRIPSVRSTGRVSFLLDYIDMLFLKQDQMKSNKQTQCGNIYGWYYCNARVILQYGSISNSTVIERIKVFTLLRRGNQTITPVQVMSGNNDWLCIS